MLKTKNKAIYFIILFIFLFITIELSGHFLFFLKNRMFLWQKQILFNAQPFIKRVWDERIVTTKNNFLCNDLGWAVATDENGFRIGSNIYYKEKDNFIFLGDSVLFGFGIDGDKSVPSLFFSLIDSYGVINAAVPSYSLFQSIEHYKYEIDGKWPVKCVILQTIDPAMQFSDLKNEWNKRISWASREIKSHTLFYRLSSTGFLMERIIDKIKRLSKSRVMDEPTTNYFKKENFSDLERLYDLLSRDGTPLVILPINIKESMFHNLDKDYILAINLLNEIFSEFASTHNNVYYFDIISYFNKIERKDLFIDPYHLSEQGSRIQSEFIIEELKRHDLF
ncbi:MAG: hypothetical protein ABH848_00955 [Candidatus Omnitrophota bacterium]